MTSLPAILSVLLWLASTTIGALVGFFAIQLAIARKFAELDIERVRLSSEVTGELRRINDHLEGIDKWVDNLRKRSHEIMDRFQELFVKVDRIEQRGHNVRRADKA
jgi:predicted transcriptional regulator